MPNSIRYSTTGSTLSLKKGNFYFGTGDVEKGPTVNTGYLNGVTPSASGYTIYLYNSSQPQNIAYHSANNDAQLISFTNNLAGQSFTSSTQCLNWYSTQNNYACVNKDCGSIVTNGLVSAYDFGFTPSYPQTGNTAYDISYSGANMTLYNSPQYSSQYGGGIVLDNVDDYIRTFGLDLNGLAKSNDFTVGFWCIKEYYGTGGNNVGNSNLINAAVNGYGSGWRITEGSQGTPGNPFSGRHYFNIGMPDLGNGISVYDSAAIYRPVYIVLSVNPTNRFVYCNGGIASGATGTYVSGATYGYIGTGDYGVGRWGGKIFNIQFYNRGLSLNEVKQNYLAYLNRIINSNIVTNGLSLYLDAGYSGSYPTSGTTWADISGNATDGTLTNGPTYINEYGGSLKFDGTNDYFTVNTTLPITSTFSLEYAVLIEDLPTSSPAEYNYIYQNGSGYRTNGVYAEFGAGPFFTFCQLNAPSNAAAVSLNETPKSNLLYYVSVTYENRTLKGYKNGKLISTNTLTFDPTLGSTGTLRIGQYGPFKIPFWRFYTRALTANEITQNYIATLPKLLTENILTSGLVFYVDAGYDGSYPTSGTTWYDVSGNDRNTSLLNGPVYNSANGGGLVFDGVDDKALISSAATESTGIRLGDSSSPWMVNVWIKTTVSGDNQINTNPILTNQSGGPVYSSMGIGSGGVMKYAHYYNTWIVDVGTIPVNNGSWHMLTWVNLNNNTMNLYVDGVFDKNISSIISGGGNINPVDSIGFGWAGYLNATISNLSIYKRNYIYSSDEVLQNFNAQKSRFGL